MALTGKKRLFADAVIAGKSNRDAAIAAGYSPKTASASGSRLVKDPDVAKYLKERRKTARKDPAAAPADAPPKPVPKFDLSTALAHKDPKAFLLAAMNDLELEPRQRIEAAKTLMPFMHQKLGEGGKKEQQQAEAQKVASRFSAAAPPKLVAAGGRKV
ncbi:hypothetical protein N234_31675 [Ralstonia pickettii DTP0602]|nr:hypothetical protein N234_31675 [Ralstonia pickettii DTP0602]